MTPSSADCATATSAWRIVDWLTTEPTNFKFVPPARLMPEGACQSVSTYAFGPSSSAGSTAGSMAESTATTPSELFEMRFQTFGAADPIPTRDYWLDVFVWKNGPYRATRPRERKQTRELELSDRLRQFDFASATAACAYDYCQIYLVRDDVLVVIDIESNSPELDAPGDWNDAIVDLVAEIDKALNAVK